MTTSQDQGHEKGHYRELDLQEKAITSSHKLTQGAHP
jgi:hypothetical protein